jgi:hypothetical protein
MAHYAKISNNNIVEQVVVVNDEDILDENGNESEYIASIFLQSVIGLGSIWKKTSYNTKGGIHRHSVTNKPSEDQSKAFRKNYAGIGYNYDEQRDAFIPPKPFPSWVLNEFSCLWESPTPRPTGNNFYKWNEETQSWDLDNT